MTISDQEKLRSEYKRLFDCESLKDAIELMNIYAECLFQVVRVNQSAPVYKDSDADARIVLQMMLTKTLTIRSILSGISYDAEDGNKLNNIIDPTILASLIRNLYETVGMFNLIYRMTQDENERFIIYNLWVVAGLKYRQRFTNRITITINKQKQEDELNKINQITENIRKNPLYLKLDTKNQRKIDGRIKDKEYLMKFEDDKVVFLSWQDLSKHFGKNSDLFDQMYTYFSLYAHPSNVAVFQFQDMFKPGEEAYKDLVIFKLKYFGVLTSSFIADYINLFPDTLKTFENLSLRNQIIIEAYNHFLRGDSYAINKCLDHLG